MRHLFLSALKGSFIFLSLFLPASVNDLQGQGSGYLYYYRVYFKDKNANPSSYTLNDLFSARAVTRRTKAGNTDIEYSDIPVNSDYISQVSAKGFLLHSTSRWMNTGLFKTSMFRDPNEILSFPFVREVRLVKRPGVKRMLEDKLHFETSQAVQPFDRPLTQVNGYALHNSGFNGKGVLIAVLDGGFINAENIEALASLRKRNGIILTKDFVKKKISVFDASDHGTAVMTVLAGNIPGKIAGTAPGADFILLKTEDDESEFPCEEDFWAAGAEFADSIGVDVISCSLGYSTFDDPLMNYKQSDLDGNTAFVTRAADMAAKKGILVVNSAGNERNNEWKKITFPSDGDSVIAAGAVTAGNIITTFSSAGPSADGDIKPDNCAMGAAVPVQTVPGTVKGANGTSFSCPVLSGITACLIQAVPQARISDIIDALHHSGDRFANPDSLYGYGIPDMGAALVQLQDKYLTSDEQLTAYPNPTTGTFDLVFKQATSGLKLEIITVDGKTIFVRNYPFYMGKALKIEELQKHPGGIYFIRITTSNSVFLKKIIKLREP